MAEPLSITSGIAGLITLGSEVLAAGYKYVNSVASAKDDIKSLVHETALLSTVLSQLISHSLSEETAQRSGSHTLVQQDVLHACEKTLRNIRSLICDFELTGGNRRGNAVNSLLWPLKQQEISKNRERLGRLCAILRTAISIENTSNLRTLQQGQEWGNEAVRELARNADEMQEQKMLDWLSTLDPTAKHTTATLLQQPGTYGWFLKEQTVLDWLDHGKLLWLNGASGAGKTILM